MGSSFRGRLLLADPNVETKAKLESALTSIGYDVGFISSLTEARYQLSAMAFDVVLLDINLAMEKNWSGLSTVLNEAPYVRVYVLTSCSTPSFAAEAVNRGAHGFLEKSGDLDQLAKKLLSIESDRTFATCNLAAKGLIGQSPAIYGLINAIERLNGVDSVVLIHGESGTGKEVVARAIHAGSARKGERFDAVNCGAIPENLLESELFGHKRGSYTDAKTDRKGIFELCSKGTLLLDEIGDMPLSLQMKLLRVLQEWEVTPVGCSTPVKVNTRVISATHHDLLCEAQERRFREDLYYRLSVVVLRIPPLRDRKEDIPLLAEHFLELLKQRFNRDLRPISQSLMAKMMAYCWPGNVRELQNSLERAVVMAKNDEIDGEEIFVHLSGGAPVFKSTDKIVVDLPLYDMPLTEAKHEFERGYLEHHLRVSKGQIVNVAEKSGRYRADVYRMLSRHGIDQDQYRPF